ncbi:MAG: hypothetical protein AB7S75_11015 [Desulfococcaceae bacterium]
MAEKYKIKQVSGLFSIHKVKQASSLFPESQQKLEAFDTFSAEQDSRLLPINKVVHDQFSFYIIKITVSDYAYANPTYLLL